jgi:hypothetical protein
VLDDWCRLYDVLIARHSLRGIKAFSREAFAQQLAVPGLRMFRASTSRDVAAMQIWYVQNRIAYNHLTAMSDDGYAVRAGYVLYAEALTRLADEADWADLGGAAGLRARAGDGLADFKRGWADQVRLSHLCGRTCDPDAYRALTARRPGAAEPYFPAYRSGELA